MTYDLVTGKGFQNDSKLGQNCRTDTHISNNIYKRLRL
jgi:hypothetical protein